MTGQPSDISTICEYGWWEWVIYRIEGQKFPFQHQKLGKTLGPAKNAGSMMSQWILTATGEVMPIQILRRLTPAENNSEFLKARMREFMKFIVQKYGDSISPPPKSEEINKPFVEDDLYQLYEGLYGEESETLPDADDIVDLDLYMDAEVMLPEDGE